jgi:molybdopterin converting factor small subunit
VKLKVKFLASLSELTGVLKTEVEVPDGVTVRKLIDRHINGKIWEAERGVVRRKRQLKADV